MNPREPAAKACRPLRIRAVAKMTVDNSAQGAGLPRGLLQLDETKGKSKLIGQGQQRGGDTPRAGASEMGPNWKEGPCD